MRTLLRSKYGLLAAMIGLNCLLLAPAYAGTVVVRKSTEPFDAFALRDELARQHEWQQALRQQQQLNILRSLPLGCLVLETPHRYFTCGSKAYRQYDYRGEALFIQIPQPPSHPATQQ